MQAISEWTLTSRLKLATSAVQFRRSFQRRNEKQVHGGAACETVAPRGRGTMRNLMILVLLATTCYAQEPRDGNFWRGGICPRLRRSGHKDAQDGLRCWLDGRCPLEPAGRLQGVATRNGWKDYGRP